MRLYLVRYAVTGGGYPLFRHRVEADFLTCQNPLFLFPVSLHSFGIGAVGIGSGLAVLDKEVEQDKKTPIKLTTGIMASRTH